MNHNIKNVIDEIQPLREKLKNHELYESLKSIEDINDNNDLALIKDIVKNGNDFLTEKITEIKKKGNQKLKIDKIIDLIKSKSSFKVTLGGCVIKKVNGIVIFSKE